MKRPRSQNVQTSKQLTLVFKSFAFQPLENIFHSPILKACDKKKKTQTLAFTEVKSELNNRRTAPPKYIASPVVFHFLMPCNHISFCYRRILRKIITRPLSEYTNLYKYKSENILLYIVKNVSLARKRARFSQMMIRIRVVRFIYQLNLHST